MLLHKPKMARGENVLEILVAGRQSAVYIERLLPSLSSALLCQQRFKFTNRVLPTHGRMNVNCHESSIGIA